MRLPVPAAKITMFMASAISQFVADDSIMRYMP
jgi:hypothetical protein